MLPNMNKRSRKSRPSDVPQGKHNEKGNVTKRGSRAWLAAGLFIVVVLVVYIPAISGQYIWDDDYYVTNNRTLTSLAGLGRIWFEIGATIQYYPMVFTTFWMEFHIWGLVPHGYHVVNVLLHACGALLLFGVLRKLSVPAAGLAAAVFALHPVHVESVAWITERKNVLSGVFYLAAMWLYLRFAESRNEPHERPTNWRAYFASLVLYACALLSKTVTCSLPAALVLLLWWKRKRLRVADLAPLVPMFAVGLVLGLTTVWVEREHVGAKGAMWDLSALERYLIAGRALWFYVGKLVWPSSLTFSYPKWDIDTGVWWQYLFPAAAIALVVSLWMLRRRVGKGPLVAALLFGGTLLPALGFIDIYPMRFSFVADHFQYLASIAVTTLLVVVVARGITMMGSRRKPTTGGDWFASKNHLSRVGPASILLVVLAILTWRQAGVYADQETLWNDTIAKNPASWMAHNNLGQYLGKLGRRDEAFEHFTAAVKLRPEYVLAQKNLGDIYIFNRELDVAERHYREAIRIEPRYAEAHSALGVALAQQGKMDEAIVCMEQAVTLKPTYTAGHTNLGLTLANLGRFDDAVQAYTDALKTDPTSADAYFNMALALTSMGKTGEAIEFYKSATRYRPAYGDAFFNLGNLYATLGRLDEAAAAYRNVLRINPSYAKASRALQRMSATP